LDWEWLELSSEAQINSYEHNVDRGNSAGACFYRHRSMVLEELYEDRRFYSTSGSFSQLALKPAREEAGLSHSCFRRKPLLFNGQPSLPCGRTPALSV